MTAENTPHDTLEASLLAAILPLVAFDGWSASAFGAAVAKAGIPQAQAQAAFPRGAVDLAVAHHRAGDRAMLAVMAEADLEQMRYSDRVAFAVRTRLDQAGDREVIRRGSAMFALPQYAGDGAALIWGTADAIWTALGDNSRDGNWYTKRAILSGVYASSVLFWLGDTSDGARATRDFVDRRIANVMAFEKFKSDMRASKVFGPLANGVESILAGVSAPKPGFADDLPGTWKKEP